MHKSKRKWILIGLAVLLIAVLVGFTLTRQTTPVQRTPTDNSAGQPKLVNETPLETALSLTNVPSTSEEQQLAIEAIRVADHEVDMAFAMALQQAQQHPPAQNGETQQINARIHSL